MIKTSEPFWLNDPKVLFQSWKFFPTKNMTNTERLNALTRLLLLVALILFLLGYAHALTILILGLLLIILLRSTQKEGFGPHRGNPNPCGGCGFPSHLSYINTKYEESPQNQYAYINNPEDIRSYTHAHYKVVPVDIPAPARQTWQREAKWCNEFSQYPNSYTEVPVMENSYANYPTNKCYFDQDSYTDNLPKMSCPDRRFSSCAVTESAFMRDTSDYRNNILGSYSDQIYREYNYNCPNARPGRKTW